MAVLQQMTLKFFLSFILSYYSVYYCVPILRSLLMPRNQVTVVKIFDVGQGDSIYIKTGEGKVILVDGGDNYSSDMLLSREMQFPFCHLANVFLTHPHADHLRGLVKILQRCSADVITFNDISYSSADYAEFKKIIRQFKVKNVFIGEHLNIDEVSIFVVWPPKTMLQASLDNPNNISTVFVLKTPNSYAVFTGDVDTDIGAGISIINNALKAIVGNHSLYLYKVPHHGAEKALNMELFYNFHPKYCPISVGNLNRYGHPNLDVVAFMQAQGCIVYRTDELGTIEFVVP